VYAGYPTSEFLSYGQNSVARAKFEYPNYNDDTVHNDIVLVELRNEFRFNKFIQAINLPENVENVPVGSECAIIGFGKTEIDDSKEDRKLKVGFIYVISQRECISIYGRIIRDSNICANHPTASTGVCRGDSGGPLACFDDRRKEYVLRGVTSFGSPNCGDRKSPEVWSRITWYMNWIKELMIECDFPKLPTNVYTNTLSTQTKFKVGEVMSLFCNSGFKQSGSTQVECQKDGFFNKIDTECVEEGFYSDWKIGTCSVTCATGTRLDTRECVAGVCDEPLNRVSTCRLRPCPSGDDVCAALSCSNNAVCDKSSAEFKCTCLPGFGGNGFSCEKEEIGKLVRSNLKIAGPFYSEWEHGKCEGVCGIGQRLDSRKCARGDCKEELSRTVDCDLPNACEDKCKNLNCSEKSRCAKLSPELPFQCKCLPGYFGNGTVCSSAKIQSCSITQVLIILIVGFYYHP